MNTQITNKAFGKHAQKALAAGAKRLSKLENMWSRYIHKSEISRINASAGIKTQRVSSDTYELLSMAKCFSAYSQGLFDLTVGPLVDLWNYKHATHIPDARKISLVLPLVSYADLNIDPKSRTAGLNKRNQSLDLGGIGKGFACDQVLKVFKSHDITSAVMNIGGNVAVIGTKPDGAPWRVGIRHPRLKGKLIGLIPVINKSVVTAGDDQRFFVDGNGKRYHHVLNPTTGYPSNSGLLSVTVISESSAIADALSTILFIAGINKGADILKRFTGTDAVFMATDNKVYITSGLNDTFQADGDINTISMDEKE
jgi:thiamine biosynthesis lipoprotein